MDLIARLLGNAMDLRLFMWIQTCRGNGWRALSARPISVVRCWSSCDAGGGDQRVPAFPASHVNLLRRSGVFLGKG